MGENCSSIDIGINGSGRISLGVANEILGTPELGEESNLVLAGVNVRSERDPFRFFGAELISDVVYGQFGPVVDAKTVSYNQDTAGSSVYGQSLEVKTRDGGVHEILFSASDIATGIDWSSIRNGGGLFAVVDASTMKTDDFRLGSSGALMNPEFRNRHPGHHLLNGAGIVIVSSPLDLPANVDGYRYQVPTFIAGVNDSSEAIAKAFENEKFCISASSCSTGAVSTTMRVMHDAGVGLAEIGSSIHISHANTESDSALHGSTVRSSGSGSQSEVARIFRNMGVNLDRNLKITCNRVPLQTGSELRASFLVMGRWTIEGFVEAMQDVTKQQGLTDNFGIETRIPLDSSYIKGDRRTVVMGATQIQAEYSAGSDTTHLMMPFWFDNEAGYSANLLRLLKTAARVR